MKRFLFGLLGLIAALNVQAQDTDRCVSVWNEARVKAEYNKAQVSRKAGKSALYYSQWHSLLEKAPCYAPLLEDAINYYQLQWFQASTGKDDLDRVAAWKDTTDQLYRRHIRHIGVKGISLPTLLRYLEILDPADTASRVYYFSVWADSSQSGLNKTEILSFLSVLQGNEQFETRYNSFYTRADQSLRVQLDSLVESNMDCSALQSRFQQLLLAYPDSLALLERMVERLKYRNCNGSNLYLQLNELLVSKESLVDEMVTLAENQAFAGNFEKASEWMQKAILAEKNPANKAKLVLQQGNYFQAYGNYERAYLNSKRAAQLDPSLNPEETALLQMKALELGSRKCPPKFRYLALMKAIQLGSSVPGEKTAALVSQYRNEFPEQQYLDEMGLPAGTLVKSECWPLEEILVISAR